MDLLSACAKTRIAMYISQSYAAKRNNFCTHERFVQSNDTTMTYSKFTHCSNLPTLCYDLRLKVDRYSYYKNPAQESRTQNRVTIFTRRSRKLINKMKELPK